MLDILLLIWKIFAIIVIVLAIIFLLGWVFVKFIEFWKDNEGDDYRR